ncbi:MAG: nucleoside triphosphate pyrophosphohydrolase [Candidatus Eisenbacteria bacterium]|uniref:Nucleoside triphosphate pyrophosphohydrolase n=1 Tax=Eiseniibacteriota bacterium TaxID=2212470 RepID=A0A538SBX4_UNCEI|nr:MAG: nucleoside triphosphate pyrophosphohydrolase [Candidatus Eisenbacteria bacterium]
MSEREQKAFTDLVAVCRRLRGPDGCPWDKEQTLQTMTPYLTEEAVESAEAIASGDADHVAEELGDLAFLAIFCLELLGEQKGPGLADALERAAAKLIRRHPHVYGDTRLEGGDAAFRQWQEIKQSEKPGKSDASLLGEQPRGLPALIAAYRTQEKAGAVGFDWPETAGALAKVREELGEIERELSGDVTPALAREIGDLLFSVVNVARRLGVDPERELRAATHRFRDRFQHIERRLAERGTTPARATLSEMDALWDEAKARGDGALAGDPPVRPKEA